MRKLYQRTRKKLGIVMTALMLAIPVFAGGVTADLLGIKDIWTMCVNAAETPSTKKVVDGVTKKRYNAQLIMYWETGVQQKNDSGKGMVCLPAVQRGMSIMCCHPE